MTLRFLLADATYFHVPFGGVGYMIFYEHWSANLAQAQLDLAAESAALQQAVAAYMTLGTEGHAAWAVSAETLASVTLDPPDYVAARGLAPLDDADGDRVWNRLEWMHVIEEFQITDPDVADAALYADWAMDPTLPADEDIDIGLDLPDGDATNWDYSHLPRATVTFNSSPDLPIEVRILGPPGREDVPVPIGQPVDIPLGAELLITLAEGANPDWFYTWSAPGNMIDGSAEKTERFRLMRSATIQPLRRPTTTESMGTTLGSGNYTYEWSGVGPFGHLVVAGSGPHGSQIQVPKGAYLRLRAYTSEAPPDSGETSTAGVNKKFAESWSYEYGNKTSTAYGSPAFNLDPIEEIKTPGTAQTPTYGWWTHTVTGSDGGIVGIGEENGVGIGFDDDHNGCLYTSVKVRALAPRSAPTQRIQFVAFANVGYELSEWDIPGVVPIPEPRDFLRTSALTNMELSGSAQFIEKQQLRLEVEVVDGNGTPAEAGHITATRCDAQGNSLSPNAPKFFSNFGVEYVALDATAHIGYYFTHWEGDGVAYPDDDGEPDLESPLPLDDPDIPVTDASIWIAMGEDWGGGTKGMAWDYLYRSRKVKAKMRPESALIVEGGGLGWFTGSHASSALHRVNFDSTTLAQPSVEELLAQLPDHEIFVFNGHGSSGVLIINDEGEITLSYDDVDVGDNKAYKLIFLNSCNSAAIYASGWLNAFNCPVGVGWNNTVGSNTAEAFDYHFWEYAVQKGVSITTAVNNAWQHSFVQLQRMIEGEPGVPVIIENGGIALNPITE